MATVTTDDRTLLIEVPPTAYTLEGFREWAYSGNFPDRGKITFVEGRLLIDMSPERIESHLKVKGEIEYVITGLVKTGDLGEFYPDGALLVHEQAEISNEPDAMMALWETLESGRLAPPIDRHDDKHIELVGTPDWICEIVSDSSVEKDTVTLQKKYHDAQIPEYWLIDARSDGDKVDFHLLVWKPNEYAPAAKQEGWQFSPVFGKWFKLTRSAGRLGRARYDLQVRD